MPDRDVTPAGGPAAPSEGSLRPIRKSPLFQEVADRLREFIDVQNLAPGDRLMSERELAVRLGVSRTSVRQALATLRVVGLIDIRHGDGIYLLRAPETVISSLALEVLKTHEKYPAIMEVREALETQAAGLAARRRSPADLDAMREALDAMESAIAAGDDGVLGDRRFHQAITAAAGNVLLTQVMDELADPVDQTSQASLARQGRPPESLKAHWRIFQAIEQHDEASAREEMRKHLVVTGDLEYVRHPD